MCLLNSSNLLIKFSSTKTIFSFRVIDKSVLLWTHWIRSILLILFLLNITQIISMIMEATLKNFSNCSSQHVYEDQTPIIVLLLKNLIWYCIKITLKKFWNFHWKRRSCNVTLEDCIGQNLLLRGCNSFTFKVCF